MLLNSRIFWTQFVAIFSIAAVHITALEHNLYFYVRWLDIPQHFFGGMWVALAFLWLCAVKGRHQVPFLYVFFTVLTIGGLWELYEYVFGISYGPTYVFDTSKDLLMDSCGAIVAYLFARQFLLPKISNT
jgi:hypothetical protein